MSDPDQGRAAGHYLEERFGKIEEDGRRYGDELERVLADVARWAGAVCDAAGLPWAALADDSTYPEPLWFAAQIRARIVELRNLRDHDPQDAVVRALFLGELIGEARAHLTHGRNAARGLHLLVGARAGHAQVHGDEEAKHRRWRSQLKAYEQHRRAGHPKTVAVQLAAEELKVSVRSIYKARARFK